MSFITISHVVADVEAPGGEKWEHLKKSGGKQWQATPKNFPRMQGTRAIPVAWLNSGLCPDRPKGWIPIIIKITHTRVVNFIFFKLYHVLISWDDGIRSLRLIRKCRSHSRRLDAKDVKCFNSESTLCTGPLLHSYRMLRRKHNRAGGSASPIPAVSGEREREREREKFQQLTVLLSQAVQIFTIR